MRKLLSVFASLLFLFGTVALPVAAQQAQFSYPPAAQSRGDGVFSASQYAVNPLGRIAIGNTATGSQTITLVSGQTTLPDGRVVQPFAVNNTITIADANPETDTITAVSGCAIGAAPNTCQITASFTSVHGASAQVISGSLGLYEAMYDAWNSGGGTVAVDSYWGKIGGTSAMLTASPVWPTVNVIDTRNFAPQFWNYQPSATVLATPTTLTALTAVPSAAPVGAFGTGTYHMCIAYVDVLGQEGNCSADFSQAGLATGSFIFSAPAASTGAVGYTIYIGLTGGGVTNLDYKVPLVAQATAIGAYPVSNGVCTLTTIETTTPACAVANTTYGQLGATGTVTVITLNTSPINPETTIISTTSIYVPNPGGRNAYVLTPGSHIGTPGMPAAELVFPVTAAAGTLVPSVLGSLNIPPGYMNFVGRTIRVCGEATTTASTATIVDIQFQWDAMGQNTAGKGVQIGDLTATPGVALVAGKASFCQDFETTITGATATGGTINHVGALGGVGGTTLIAGGVFTDAQTAGAVGSLNLANEARINVIYVHTTATDGAGWLLQSLTLQVVN